MLAPLLTGLVRKVKARLQRRQGPPLIQPYRDLKRLLGKEVVLVAFGITFGGLILALALAFGLGGRALARQILERRLRQDPHPSETLTHL